MNILMIKRVVMGYTARIKQADYPDHPKSTVISKGDRITPGPEIRELDVWNYYSGIKGKMLPELKGRNLFISMKLEGQTGKKPLYIRHPFDKKTEYIRVSNDKDFEKIHTGRTVEVHVTMPASCPYYIVDFDAVEDWATTKKITADIADALDKNSDVKKVEIRYSGKRGFHVLGWLKQSKPIDKARKDLKEWLKATFGDRDDLVLGESPKGSKGALGVSPMKLNGGQVALWSLRVTGLCCVEVPRSKLMGFKWEDASLEKTYKRLTGKSFVFEKIKEAALRVLAQYIAKETPKKFSPDIGAPLEVPTKRAVEVTQIEHPVSSGWHSGFSESFNGLSPCWAIIYHKKVSKGLINAAEKAGLSVFYRTDGDVTISDVYLAGVKKSEEVKAKEIFNKFADLYKETF